jgi:hypothetical protein
MEMSAVGPEEYEATIPADFVIPGLIRYRIMTKKSGNHIYEKLNRVMRIYPGNLLADPYAWDYIPGESYETFVAGTDTPIEIFNANTDRGDLVFYNPNWRNNSTGYTMIDKPGQLVLRMSMKKSDPGQFMAFQHYITSKLEGRQEELPSFSKLVIRARSGTAMKIKLNLITRQADAWSATIDLDENMREIEIPLSSLKKDSFLLLPRPYPGFLPLSFKSESNKNFNISDVEKLEVSFGKELQQNPTLERIIEIESVRLIKN